MTARAEVDCGQLAFKPEATQGYFTSARQHFKALKSSTDSLDTPLPILQAYTDVNHSIAGGCSPGWLVTAPPLLVTDLGNEQTEANERVLDHVIKFINAVDERRGSQPHKFLEIDDYVRLRRDTSAVYGLVYLIESVIRPFPLVGHDLTRATRFAYQIDLPQSFYATEQVQTLIDRTTDLVALMNDLISFPKEVVSIASAAAWFETNADDCRQAR